MKREFLKTVTLNKSTNKIKRTSQRHNDVRNTGSGFGQAQKCGVVKPVNGIHNPPIHSTCNWISNQCLKTSKDLYVIY